MGNVYYVGANNIASILVATPRGHILIDTGTQKMGAVVFPNVVRLGFKPAEIKVMLISHAHYDHMETMETMRRITGATVAALAADVPALVSGHDLGSNETWSQEPIQVGHVLQTGEDIHLGGSTVKVVWTPGHTLAAQAPVNVHDGFFTGRQFLALPQEVRFFYARGLVDGIFLAPLLGAPEQNLDGLVACLEKMTNQQVAALLTVTSTAILSGGNAVRILQCIKRSARNAQQRPSRAEGTRLEPLETPPASGRHGRAMPPATTATDFRPRSSVTPSGSTTDSV